MSAQAIIDELLEYFEGRADASMEPGEDRFHGNREMSLLAEVQKLAGYFSEASRHKALLRETLDAIASEIDGMADVEDRPEGAGVRPNVFMRLDTLIEAVQGATK
jgi:hypothetical protein